MIDELRSFVDASGPLGPAVFVVAYVALTLALVPGTIPSLAAGALFGPVWGSALTIVGATICAFEIARRLGRERTRRIVGDRVLRADQRVGRHGTSAVLGLRLMPVVPFNVLDYAFGLSSVGRREHAIGTAVGIVPGTVAFVALGDSIADQGSLGFLLSLAAVVVLMSVSVVRGRRLTHVAD